MSAQVISILYHQQEDLVHKHQGYIHILQEDLQYRNNLTFYSPKYLSFITQQPYTTEFFEPKDPGTPVEVEAAETRPFTFQQSFQVVDLKSLI